MPTVDAMWEANLSDTWPLQPGWLAGIVTGGWIEDGKGVALMSGTNLAALVVEREHRRRGIGGALYAAAAPEHIACGGDGGYVWPGVPNDLQGALGFFVRRGWRPAFTTWDFTADLRIYSPPQLRYPPGIVVREATPDDVPAVLAFEARYFPQWLRWFRTYDADRIIVALDGGEVVGATGIDWPERCGPAQWSRLLGDDLGQLGIVGVDPARQNEGIGTAMVVHGSHLLRGHSVGICGIHYLVRTGFYGRAGYEPWRSYQMVERA